MHAAKGIQFVTLPTESLHFKVQTPKKETYYGTLLFDNPRTQ